MSLTGLIRAGMKLTFVGASDLGNKRDAIGFPAEIVIGNGVGAGQSDQMFQDTRTLTSSQTESLDLAGSLVDSFGVVLTFVEITAIYIKADPANISKIRIGGAAANAWPGPFDALNDKVNIEPGEVYLATNLRSATGWIVTAGTADLLDVENTDVSNAANYDISLVGRSA